MHKEASLDDVTVSNLLEAIDGIVVLRIAVRCEEVLDNFNQEENLRELQERLHTLVLLSTKGHDEEVEEHIWHHYDADNQLEHCHNWTILCQDILISLLCFALLNANDLMGLRDN